MSSPDGWHTVTPRIVTPEAEKQVGFMRHVFGAAGDFQGERPSEVTIGDSVIMVSSAEGRDPMPAFLYVYVEDVDATYQRALAVGANSIEEPRDLPYGDRRAMVSDPWANLWQIASRL